MEFEAGEERQDGFRRRGVIQTMLRSCLYASSKGAIVASRIRRKNYRIDVQKLERARRALGTRTETETIHRALDAAADEAELARVLRDLIIKGRGRIEDPHADE